MRLKSKATAGCFKYRPCLARNPIAAPSVIGADSVNAHGHAMISTAVATLTLAPASGHQATAPAAARPIAPTLNQVPNWAPTPVSHRDLGLAKIGLFQRLARWLWETSVIKRRRRTSVVTRPPARTISPR